MNTKIETYLSSLPTSSIAGKEIWITGANSGIGFALAMHLARYGANLHLCCRSEKRAQDASSKIKEAYPATKVAFHCLDVSSFAAVLRFCQEVQEKQERIDVFVHNAGILGKERKPSVDGFDLVDATNYLGLILLTETLLPYFSSRPYPVSLVFTSSVAAHFGRLKPRDLSLPRKGGSMKIYASTKRAVYQYAVTLMEEHHHNISVSLTHPGGCYTPLIAKSFSSFINRLARPFMGLFFHGPESASLPDLTAIVSEEKEAYFYPRGFLHLTGLPVKRPLPSSLKKGKEIIAEIRELLRDKTKEFDASSN